jgi:hypothetical protein
MTEKIMALKLDLKALFRALVERVHANPNAYAAVLAAARGPLDKILEHAHDPELVKQLAGKAIEMAPALVGAALDRTSAAADVPPEATQAVQAALKSTEPGGGA